MPKKGEVQTNGNGTFKYLGEINKVSHVPDFVKQLEFNEWTFSLILFFFSLFVVIGKVAVNYGYLSLGLISDSHQLPEFSPKTLESFSENIDVFENYGWIIKAVLCGLATVAFTWYIIYKDSIIPGVNPPSPLRNSGNRFKKEFEISTNYLMGLLNGLLIFLYMCF